MAIPKRLSQFLQFVIFTGVGVFILYYVYKSQNAAYIADCALKGVPNSECSLLKKLQSDFAGANYGWIALVICAYIISNIIRAHRWLMLIHTLGRKGSLVNAFFTIMVGYFANMGLPRVG
ncbi:MAG TPA: lysylphosphatidylglycerol synthase domain-containing protein, partial [Saprospiraceae bacterium]|nr:lysylphosphatidylglycerol synthase domain-containing protein [Saprospiraceae bacterium]